MGRVRVCYRKQNNHGGYMGLIKTQQIIQHLSAKWGNNKPCPMCGGGPWTVQDRTFQLMEFNEVGMVVGGAVFPVVPIMCGNCGNTILINAMLSGAIPRPGGLPLPQSNPTPPIQGLGGLR